MTFKRCALEGCIVLNASLDIPGTIFCAHHYAMIFLDKTIPLPRRFRVILESPEDAE
jgi:hypothetical protein